VVVGPFLSAPRSGRKGEEKGRKRHVKFGVQGEKEYFRRTVGGKKKRHGKKRKSHEQERYLCSIEDRMARKTATLPCIEKARTRPDQERTHRKTVRLRCRMLRKGQIAENEFGRLLRKENLPATTSRGKSRTTCKRKGTNRDALCTRGRKASRFSRERKPTT